MNIEEELMELERNLCSKYNFPKMESVKFSKEPAKNGSVKITGVLLVFALAFGALYLIKPSFVLKKNKGRKSKKVDLWVVSKWAIGITAGFFVLLYLFRKFNL